MLKSYYYCVKYAANVLKKSICFYKLHLKKKICTIRI